MSDRSRLLMARQSEVRLKLFDCIYRFDALLTACGTNPKTSLAAVNVSLPVISKSGPQ